LTETYSITFSYHTWYLRSKRLRFWQTTDSTAKKQPLCRNDNFGWCLPFHQLYCTKCWV